MQELEQQSEEQDRDGWKSLADSSGWSQEESETVWDWFNLQLSGRR
jgi:hypothetical protein